MLKKAQILMFVACLLLAVPLWFVNKAYHRPHSVSPEALVCQVCWALAWVGVWRAGRVLYKAGVASRP